MCPLYQIGALQGWELGSPIQLGAPQSRGISEANEVPKSWSFNWENIGHFRLVIQGLIPYSENFLKTPSEYKLHLGSTCLVHQTMC